ncbi:uncharacterized protein L3040_006748 [Drepanopeziza brunnea f. sp. 'multigermtubi']|uniref:Endo-chitosanase n=1 Tax=Marssonina brunnea f. sp. multigermtubi (strain MB_m1) TaxID=1072389 RepID=K1WYG9_MARBU|nr:glycoside hydrolase family 75 [Drepanopeziza brunnea f. sp. 'multigermtubi' MB_m1]EKD17627.1 glycoside hydrolase family 75 [Drepanopeziza brunnea f. sp. 'multigermtubi' MB_m1]KAJ5039078.1 hypothetical protein L3040_006748 [Drepanopeziza brunnea f. sp. 'multigermtubi']
MHTPFLAFLLTALLLASRIAARSVPANVQSFYNSVKSTGTCQNILKTGFYAKDDPPNTFSYCGTHLNDYGVIYLQGTGGALADMDIDCDGIQNGPGNDGRCGSSDDTQAHTSFEDTVAGYNKGVSGLNAFIHTYVVLGNVGTNAGFVNYDPRANGVRELSLVAVVCGNGKMFYGIWGDENGDDGPRAVIGEASISMATLCYGASAVNGNSGHDETDVLYIAFTGAAAVPGANGAKWNAASATEFEASLGTLGDTLVKRITATGITTSKTTSAAPPTATCSWSGHCLGAACATADDCSDDLVCTGGKCATLTGPTVTTSSTIPAATCSWSGHCLGATCVTGDDCSDDLVCVGGKCGRA